MKFTLNFTKGYTAQPIRYPDTGEFHWVPGKPALAIPFVRCLSTKVSAASLFKNVVIPGPLASPGLTANISGHTKAPPDENG